MPEAGPGHEHDDRGEDHPDDPRDAGADDDVVDDDGGDGSEAPRDAASFGGGAYEMDLDPGDEPQPWTADLEDPPAGGYTPPPGSDPRGGSPTATASFLTGPDDTGSSSDPGADPDDAEPEPLFLGGDADAPGWPSPSGSDAPATEGTGEDTGAGAGGMEDEPSAPFVVTPPGVDEPDDEPFDLDALEAAVAELGIEEADVQVVGAGDEPDPTTADAIPDPPTVDEHESFLTEPMPAPAPAVSEPVIPPATAPEEDDDPDPARQEPDHPTAEEPPAADGVDLRNFTAKGGSGAAGKSRRRGLFGR